MRSNNGGKGGNAFSAKLKMKIQLFLGPFWLPLSQTKSFLYRLATCKFLWSDLAGIALLYK